MLIFLNLITFLFVLSIPTISFMPMLNNVVILLGFLLGLVFLVTTCLSRYTISVPREFIIYIIWLFICLASSIMANDLNLTLSKLLTLLQIGLMFLILFNVCLWNKNISVPLYAFLLAAILNIPVALYQYYTLGIERPAGLVKNANILGLVMVLGLFSISIFYLTDILRKKGIKIFKYVLWPSLFFCSYTAFLSGSKKAIVGVGFGALGFLYAYFQEVQSRYFKIILTSILGTFFLFLFVSALNHSLVEHRFEESLDFFKTRGYKSSVAYDSTSLRYAYAIAGLKMFRENPILGVGLNNFSKNVKKFSPMRGIHKTYAHNNYIEILACTGLMGFLTYFGIYLSIIFRIKRGLRNQIDKKAAKLQVLLMLAFFFLLFFDMVAVTYYEKIPWIWFSMITASYYQSSAINGQQN